MRNVMGTWTRVGGMGTMRVRVWVMVISKKSGCPYTYIKRILKKWLTLY
jgi:hypothetical protein